MLTNTDQGALELARISPRLIFMMLSSSPGLRVAQTHETGLINGAETDLDFDRPVMQGI